MPKLRVIKGPRKGDIVNISPENFEAAKASGFYAFIEGETAAVETGYGDVAEMDVSQIGTGIDLESSIDADKRWETEQLESEYGTIGQKVITGAEGALSGVTFSGSRWLFGALGGDEYQERERARRQVNPGEAVGGEIGGAILPAMLTLGGTAPVSAASVGVSVGRAGLAAARAGRAAKTAGAAARILRATPASLAARAGSRIAARGAGGSLMRQVVASAGGLGVEGALFSSGAFLNEAALGNKELSAEGLVGAMGEGALWGAGMGAGFAAAGRGISKLGQAAERGLPTRLARAKVALQKIFPKRATTKQAVAEAKLGFRNEATKFGSKADDLLRHTDEVLPRLAPAQASALQSTADDLKNLRQGFEARFGARQMDLYETPVMGKKTIDGLMTGPDEMGKAMDMMSSYQKTALELSEMLKPHLPADTLAKITDDWQVYAQAMAARTGEAKGAAVTGWKEAFGAAQLAQDAGIPGIPDIDDLPLIGPLAGAYFKFRAVRRGLGKGASILASPLQNVAQRASGFANKAEDAVSRFAKVTEKVGVAVGKKIPRLAAPVTAEILARPLVDPEIVGRPPPKKDVSKLTAVQLQDHRKKLYDHKLEELSAAMSRIGEITANLHRKMPMPHPAMQQAITAAYTTKLNFLATKIPRDPRPPLMGQTEYVPTAVELDDFARYVRAADDPLSVLHDLEAGRVTAQAVEALRTVYPEVYAKMQEDLLSRVGELKERLPYPKRIQLSIFFDVPLDDSMRPEFILSMQEGYARATQVPEEPPASIKTAVNLGEQAQLGAERRAAR